MHTFVRAQEKVVVQEFVNFAFTGSLPEVNPGQGIVVWCVLGVRSSLRFTKHEIHESHAEIHESQAEIHESQPQPRLGLALIFALLRFMNLKLTRLRFMNLRLRFMNLSPSWRSEARFLH